MHFLTFQINKVFVEIQKNKKCYFDEEEDSKTSDEKQISPTTEHSISTKTGKVFASLNSDLRVLDVHVASKQAVSATAIAKLFSVFLFFLARTSDMSAALTLLRVQL